MANGNFDHAIKCDQCEKQDCTQKKCEKQVLTSKYSSAIMNPQWKRKKLFSLFESKEQKNILSFKDFCFNTQSTNDTKQNEATPLFI